MNFSIGSPSTLLRLRSRRGLGTGPAGSWQLPAESEHWMEWGRDLTRNLWVAFEDGTSKGCVRVRVLPVTVQVEGTNCIGQHIEHTKDLLRGFFCK